ncbi:MAG: hypothetical protein GF418_09330 [Chitinivibrionales bacterium]|nr:hypothetical protein [Chitinivibrionales bacterium]MBD3395810.1 hypothetical protein [Chitinivibrionales bacterium]
MAINRLSYIFSASFIIFLSARAAFTDIADNLNSLTGNEHTRVVWLRGGHRIDGGGTLIGFDTQTGQEIELLPASSGQNRPIICSGGHRVVISVNYKVYVMEWDNPGQKQYLVDGICSDAWVHPETGEEWIVVREGGKSTSGKLHRYRIDDVADKFLLWDKSEVGINYFQWWQISADGTLAADFLPWPGNGNMIENGGLVSNGANTQLVGGCWASVAPDNSYYWFALQMPDGHRTIKVFNWKTLVQEVELNPRPLPAGTKTNEYYHPRFAEKGARFMTCTGGYHSNGNSDDAEVYVGKFTSDYKGFEGWVRITDNNVPDYTPDAWVGVEPAGPSIRLSASALEFEADEGGANPPVQDLTVTSPAGTLEGVEAQSSESWLGVAVSGSGASYTVRNTVDISGLSSGVHSATVTISAANTQPASRDYDVTVTILGDPVAARIAISPQSARVTKGGSVTFSAVVLDQYGEVLTTQPSLSWSTTGTHNVMDGPVFTAGNVEGAFTITARAGAAEASVDIEVVAAASIHLKINCGAGEGAVDGWESDAAYVAPGDAGSPFDFGHAADVSGVSNPAPADVYRTVRHQDHSYDFAELPDATYLVRLHFMDAHDHNRRMDYTIEGEQVIDALNVTTAAGGTLKAYVEEFEVVVGDGNGMQIEARQDDGDDVFEAGIEIIGQGGGRNITVLSPSESAAYLVGTVLTVKWVAEGDIPGVSVQISPDNGLTWLPILDSNSMGKDHPDYGAYPWVIRAQLADAQGNQVSLLTDQVMVRVYDYTDQAIIGIAGPFTLTTDPNAVRKQSRRDAPRLSARSSRGGMYLSIPWPGGYTVRMYNMQGQLLSRVRGIGPRALTLAPAHAAGIRLIRIQADGRDWTIRQLSGLPVAGE